MLGPNCLRAPVINMIAEMLHASCWMKQLHPENVQLNSGLINKSSTNIFESVADVVSRGFRICYVFKESCRKIRVVNDY